MPTILKSLIQSDFGEVHGNFEAVVLRGDQLLHFWRDNADPALPIASTRNVRTVPIVTSMS